MCGMADAFGMEIRLRLPEVFYAHACAATSRCPADVDGNWSSPAYNWTYSRCSVNRSVVARPELNITRQIRPRCQRSDYFAERMYTGPARDRRTSRRMTTSEGGFYCRAVYLTCGTVLRRILLRVWAA